MTQVVVAVGTKNKTKVAAVCDTLQKYSKFKDVEILEYSVDSLVGEQPMTLKPIVLGSKNRAEAAYKAAMEGESGVARKVDFAFGIESGLHQLSPETAESKYDGWYDVCVCTCYDGKVHRLGTSCSFQIPPKLMKHVLDDKVDLSQACFMGGITTNKKLGESEGLIGVLTKGKLTRLDYTKQGLMCCLIPCENEEWFL